MTEIEAKVKYVKLARSLRTYGVSFFLVKVSQGGGTWRGSPSRYQKVEVISKKWKKLSLEIFLN